MDQNQTYTVTAGDEACYTLSTTPDSYTLSTTPDSYTLSAPSDSLLTFGYRNTGGAADVSVYLDAGILRCNFEVPLWLTIHNSGCDTLTGHASLTLPPGVDFLSASIDSIERDDSTLYFTVDHLPPGQGLQVVVKLGMPDETYTGETLRFTAIADATASGPSQVVDTTAYSAVLRCAVDPNDKQVWPRRAEPSGSNYTQLDESLRYTIRFQNVGNDTAFNVRIEDRLSTDLDWNSLQVTTASHPFRTEFSEGGLLTFYFEGILLPDSATNVTGSQGFVTFTILADSTLADFSTIDNEAAIFFDYNAPVITNTVTSTLVARLDGDRDGVNFYADCNDADATISPRAKDVPGNGIDENCDGVDGTVSTTDKLPYSLLIYPNPTADAVTLEYGGGERLRVELRSVTGGLLRQSEFHTRTTLPMAAYPPGVYVLRISEADGNRSTIRKLVKQ